MSSWTWAQADRGRVEAGGAQHREEANVRSRGRHTSVGCFCLVGPASWRRSVDSLLRGALPGGVATLTTADRMQFTWLCPQVCT